VIAGIETTKPPAMPEGLSFRPIRTRTGFLNHRNRNSLRLLSRAVSANGQNLVPLAALVGILKPEQTVAYLVCNNLNTHTGGVPHTPNTGAGPPVPEGPRFGTVEEMRTETRTWQQAINDEQRSVD
jgi:hypothetical protein